MKSTYNLLPDLSMSTFNWIRVRRTTIVLVLCLLVQLANNKAYSQSNGMSFNLKNVTVETVLNEIEAKTSFRFLYNKQLVDVTRKVTIVGDKKNVSEVLNEIFKGTDVVFNISGKQIVLSKKDPKSVSGVVTDQSGEPIIGASVKVKGTKTGTITNLDGGFGMEVPENAILSVSYIGYKVMEFSVGAKKNLIIKLDEDVKLLDEVVVTALGIKREQKALGYAVQSVQGDVLQTVKGVNVATSLSGKVAGLAVYNSTNFGEVPSITIRGEAPILVVDGVPYENLKLNDIPADDIENMSILKGATASALYGYRGAAGAIMVTTKKGGANKGISVTVNSGTLFTAGYLAIPEIQSTFGRVVNTNPTTQISTYSTGGDGSWGVPMDGRDVSQWDYASKSWKIMPYLPVGKDNFKNFLEQGYILNNNINVIQQGESGSLRASATWVSNKGQYPNSQLDKYTYSIGGDMKIDKFTLSSSMAYSKQSSPNVGFNGYTSYDPMYSLLVWSAPDYDIRLAKDYWIVPNEIQNTSYTDTNNNPYFDRNERTHSLNKDILNGTLALGYDISSWLKATVRTGFDTYSNREDIQVSMGSLQGSGSATLIPNGTQVWGESMNGSYNVGISRGYSLNNDILLTGNKTFDKFTIEGLMGGTLKFKQDEGMEAFTKGGLTIPGYYSLNASVNPAVVGTKIYREQINSLYGRLALSWNSLIYAEGTLRNDWSSTLPASTRSYLYPSVSGSFVASELLPKYSWLSLWKLRSSWNVSKGIPGIYDTNTVFDITNSAWGNLSSAAYPTTVRSADVLPYASETFEIGTAVNLLKNRVSFDLTYYSKRMYDGILYASVSPASGYYSNYINTQEETTRKGVELSTNLTPIKTKDWQWDIALNWSKYASYYTKLDPLYSENKPWVKVGERADAWDIYDYLKDSQGNIIFAAGIPQYSKFKSKFGNSGPDWVWGASTTLKHKSFQLNVSFDGRVGGLLQTTTEMYMWQAGSHPNSVVPERYLDAVGGSNYIATGVKVVSGEAAYDAVGNVTSDTRVFAPNDVAVTYQSYVNTFHHGTAWGGAPSPVDLYDATFLKLREISLSYTLAKQFSSALHVKSIMLSVVGQNVFLWAKQFKYSDPDGGYENFSDPSQRVLGFNVKISL